MSKIHEAKLKNVCLSWKKQTVCSFWVLKTWGGKWVIDSPAKEMVGLIIIKRQIGEVLNVT